jgi:2-polyprenyl-6-methoxyphenol hydroxylase-like FAD-dependent oxidoreductase
VKVLITGADIAGPAAAIALHKAGIEAELFEARPADAADTGAFVTITANGQDALAAINALPTLLDASFPTQRLRFFTPAGTLIGDFPLGRAHPCPRTITPRCPLPGADRRGRPPRHPDRLRQAPHRSRMLRSGRHRSLRRR